MLPQRGVPQRISPGIRPGVVRPSPGVPSKISPWSQRRPSQSLLSPKGVLGPKKAPPKVPTSIFDVREDWTKDQLAGELKKLLPFLFKGGKAPIKPYQAKKIVEELFPHRSFRTHINIGEAKRRLKELRTKEYWARGKIARTPAEKAEKFKTMLHKGLSEALTRIRKY